MTNSAELNPTGEHGITFWERRNWDLVKISLFGQSDNLSNMSNTTTGLIAMISIHSFLPYDLRALEL